MFLRKSLKIVSKILGIAVITISVNSQVKGQAQDPLHLKRTIDTAPQVSTLLSSKTAHFRVMFGAGDSQSDVPQILTRYGELTIDPQGASGAGSYKGEELVYYVLEGTGTFGYAGREVPISQGDFFYVPPEVDHRFLNGREASLRVMMMGFKVHDSSDGKVQDLQIANTSDVKPEVLGSHGPTVRYQLMLGGTNSERDRIAAGQQVTSLYIMDFNPGGTNQEHRHENAIEVYYILQGHGEMVAGEATGEAKRYPVKVGDAFLFTKNSPVGFFSSTEKGDLHSQILAIRANIPREE